MEISWHIPLGTILLVVANIVAIVGAYYGLKADNAGLKSDLTIAILGVRADMTNGDNAVKEQLMAIVGRVDDAVRELAHRVTTLESGQDEWTKVLRQRTHDLAEKLNVLALKVDRLERP